MTPKSLLRHKLAVSPVEEFTSGSFMEVLDDTNVDPSRVKRVVLCSGKVYYDLLNKESNRKVLKLLSFVLNNFTLSLKNNLRKSSTNIAKQLSLSGFRKSPTIWVHGFCGI